jgi:hypothetical protein
MKYILFFISFLICAISSAQIRKVVYREDQILTIKTALGIATIIQLPETIQSAIIGDQSGFKIEYLDRAVTIKPLRGNAKTNLYLVTDKKRYNVRLHTKNQDGADYIVYILSDSNNGKKSQTRWITSKKSSEANGLILTLERLGYSQGDFVLLDLSLKVNTNERLSLRPEDVWIYQESSSKVINSLFLPGTKLEKDKPVKIGISLSRSELAKGKPVRVELKGTKTVSISISEAAVWK